MEGGDDASASLSPADASRMGKAAEHLIAAFCIMATRGANERLHGRYLAAMRDRALFRLLADLGPRVSEDLDRDLTDLSYQRGQRTLTFAGKGRKPRERPLVAHTLEALDDYLVARLTPRAAPSTR